MIKWLTIISFILLMGLNASAQSILFVGNSLTYTNNLPELLETIADDFEQSIETTCLCYANFSLEDHWNKNELQSLIASEKFDIVILQQGPSSQLFGKEMLMEYGKRIADLCDQHNSKLAFYMVWPALGYYHTFEDVIKNYEEAAKLNDAEILPVGINWKDFRSQNITEELYDNDNFHPSKAGSFLAALTIFYSLFPNEDLSLIKFKVYSNWVFDKNAFKEMIDIVSK